MKITKIVKAMKEGKYKTSKELHDEKKNMQNKGPYLVLSFIYYFLCVCVLCFFKLKKNIFVYFIYQIWNDQEDDILAESRRYKFHLPAPKMPLPGHAESYNPPPEYLLNEEEKKKFDEMDPSERF
jgi:hypothetical protein